MTQKMHSPAPWNNRCDANGKTILLQDSRVVGIERNPEWQANRALFDAGPELLEALTEIRIQRAEDGSLWLILRPSGPGFAARTGFQLTAEDGIAQFAISAWAEKAAAAVAKATGEAA